MAIGRSPPSLVMAGQGLVTQADHVATMAREMGHPLRLIRGPDLYDLFQAREEARLPGLVDRWAASGLAAQVVYIPPPVGHHPATNGQAVPLAHRPPGCSARAVHVEHHPHQERRDELDDRPRPRGTRPDRTPPN